MHGYCPTTHVGHLGPLISNEFISLGAQTVKHLPAVRETWVSSPGWEHPRRRQWQPSPVLLPGECHEWRSLIDAVHGVANSQT